MDCKFYLCLLVIMLGTITVHGAARQGIQQGNPMHEYAKRGDGWCTQLGLPYAQCSPMAIHDSCPRDYYLCGVDEASCGAPPAGCCCMD
ncbi:small cysteine-rich protein 1-like [Oculina patagonica]